MPKLKGRLISKEEAVADINRYLDFRALFVEHIKPMLDSHSELSVASNQPFKQYFNDNENSFFFDMDMLQKLIDKGRLLGGNCIRIYYGAATKPTKPESLQLFNDLKINEGSSTLVVVPCLAEFDSTTGEVKSVKNVMANDGGDEDGGQWPGGSFMAIDSRVANDCIDDTRESNISMIPGSSVFL